MMLCLKKYETRFHQTLARLPVPGFQTWRISIWNPGLPGCYAAHETERAQTMESQSMTEREAIFDYLTDLWKTILAKETDAKSNFFEMGGNSLTALKMIMKVQADLNVELAAETFFEEPCIENLTTHIMNSRR